MSFICFMKPVCFYLPQNDWTDIKMLDNILGFITQTAVPTYERWLAASSLTRQSFFVQRYLNLRIRGIKHRLNLFKAYSH